MSRLAALNAADEAGFIAALGHLFEHSPWVVARTAAARPFVDAAALHQALLATVAAATPEEQLALIRAHPDLAGKAALAGDLTEDSASEQASAGLDRLTREEFDRFQAANRAYWDRFAMPFIICVRQHTKQSILAAFDQRLARTREQEVAAALAEIGAITRLRLLDWLEKAP